MVPILVNKDVFESYNDLKFMVQNCNYFCPNLIGMCQALFYVLGDKEENKTHKNSCP